MTTKILKPARLDYHDQNFIQQLEYLLAWENVSDAKVYDTVKEIITAVRRRGDWALLNYTRRFDRVSASSMNELIISKQQLHNALESISDEQRHALETAAARIRTYHERQVQESWSFKERNGTRLGQKVQPMDRVGLYVPGGQATYPSSVLMNAIPARVAGVEEIIMVVPTPDGVINDMVLAAAALAGVHKVFTIGGAQAIAALAYGTVTVPRVDKIVGPGNSYVATAKREVFGQVGIDMIAGPSEILVVCDGLTDPDWIAMDLFSQAEHDEDAQAILVSDNLEFLHEVDYCMNHLVQGLERSEIIKASINNRGALIHVPNLKAACDVVNRIAPEHLELSVANPEALLPDIRHAGAIFMGRHTAEALGDYCAGPNHVLPTSGTSRFSSPLGVYDFQKRSSLIHFSDKGASEMGKVASVLARGESLTAHARSAEFRIKK
ncbi:histidinol dehydrogenase [Endozoicomonas euniceicola]|uniref:Histidinol dehydrogenase n=1 Tax=Endozoicomonas euniceicola TaxID=1234143 RepID=A0ABY6GP21_9GAMM|nr:histidinol dehydrogenase [Endozoicomonas euniceicola]UYM14496.1 histidinol dehydrogenase [Endozoicomonas euniceicola]